MNTMPTNEEMTNDCWFTNEDRKRKADFTTNPDDAIDDEVAAHHPTAASDKESLPSPKKGRMNNRDGSQSHPNQSPTLPEPPPLVQRTKEHHRAIGPSVGGFDSTSLTWLQCMEEVATVWLNMLVQQQNHNHLDDNLFKEKNRIVDFCTRTLQQIMSEGGFRSYTTPSFLPSLYRQQLPPLQDLPCMVVSLKYWYCTLLSRCQHQTAVSMLPHRILAPQQLSRISIHDYIRACEDEVKRWLRDFVTSEPTTSNVTSDDEKSKGSRSHVAVWMQQLQTKSVPTYSPVKPKPTMTTTTQPHQVVLNQTKEGRMPSPTDVMMFDSATTPIMNIHDGSKDDEENDEDKKPAAKISITSLPSIKNSNPKIDMNSKTHLPQNYISKEKANRMRGLILSLYHANKCPFNNVEDGEHRCPISKGCRTVKDLWNHITVNRNRNCCVQHTCPFGRLSLEAEEALTHYGHCKKKTCPICGPVLVHMPKVKRNIKAAVEVSKRHAAAVEEAVLHVVEEISNEIDLTGMDETMDEKTIPKPDGIVTSIQETLTTSTTTKAMVPKQ
jgi:TAZ zinc finger